MSSIPPNSAGASAYRDNCPECVTGPYEPLTTRMDGESLLGVYRCDACLHSWRCWWAPQSLPEDNSSAGDAA